MSNNIEIFVCWTDETTKHAHVARWLTFGVEADIEKANAYVANIGGMVLHYDPARNVQTVTVRLDYVTLRDATASSEREQKATWYRKRYP